MKRLSILIYGVASYCVFLATFLYTIGFVGNLFVPKSIDSEPSAPLLTALAVDAVLLAIFAVQHSVMARPFFKRWLQQWIPESAERSTYVLASSLALILLVTLWQPLGGIVWQLDATWAVSAAHAVFAAGWLLVLISTFQINHFDLFGLRQVWLQWRGQPYTPVQFKLPWMYRYVRHPLYVGFFLGIWATPTMTVTHLFFAVMTAAYIVIGTRLEERDLRDVHPEYAAYADSVPRYLPKIRGSRSSEATARAS